MKYARIIDNTVGEVFVPLEGFTIEDSFTPQVVALFEPVSDEVEVGWIRLPNGTIVKNPEPPSLETSNLLVTDLGSN